jgi:hypothetical protein
MTMVRMRIIVKSARGPIRARYDGGMSLVT